MWPWRDICDLWDSRNRRLVKPTQNRKSMPNGEVGIRTAQFSGAVLARGAGVDVDATGAAGLLLVARSKVND
jgi:hypothetical protein